MAAERRRRRRGVERGLDHRVDQASLSGKTRKIVPSAIAGGLRDLAGGDGGAVREQEREGGGHDGGPAFLGRQRGRPS